jgi:hypothetical protein
MKQVITAGEIIVSYSNNILSIVLVEHEGGGWTFPKGSLGEGENI